MLPIVILHGALGSHHQFTNLAAAIDADVSVIDFEGHGSANDADEPWTIELFSRQLEKELMDRGLAGARIFGYSMGGYVALDCAIRRPDLVSRILTLGTKLSWSLEQAVREIKLLDADTISAKVPAFAFDLGRRHGDSRWRDILKHTAHLMTGLGTRPVLSLERMQQCSASVRFLIGDRDEMVSLEETIEYYRATPKATLAVLPNTRHPIEKVNQKLVLEHIDAHLLSA